MTLQDLLDHHRAQLKAVEAYFSADVPEDGKTRKTYRKHVEQARERVELLEKLILDRRQSD